MPQQHTSRSQTQILRLQLHLESAGDSKEKNGYSSKHFHISLALFTELPFGSSLCAQNEKTTEIYALIFRSFVLARYLSILNSFSFEGENCCCEETHQVSNFVALALWEHKKFYWFLYSPSKVLYQGLNLNSQRASLLQIGICSHGKSAADLQITLQSSLMSEILLPLVFSASAALT